MIANFRGFGKFRHLETFCFDGCFRMLLENSNSVPYRLLSTNPDTCSIDCATILLVKFKKWFIVTEIS
jgi:hypothetical protein